MNSFIEFIDSKMKQYEDLRAVVYKLIDTTHYSLNNISMFSTITNLSIRLDELSQLKTRLKSDIEGSVV